LHVIAAQIGEQTSRSVSCSFLTKKCFSTKKCSERHVEASLSSARIEFPASLIDASFISLIDWSITTRGALVRHSIERRSPRLFALITCSRIKSRRRQSACELRASIKSNLPRMSLCLSLPYPLIGTPYMIGNDRPRVLAFNESSTRNSRLSQVSEDPAGSTARFVSMPTLSLITNVARY